MPKGEKSFLARYLSQDIQQALKTIAPTKPFRVKDLGLSRTSSEVASELKRYGAAEKVKHNHGKGGYWRLTDAGRKLVQQLGGQPKKAEAACQSEMGAR